MARLRWGGNLEASRQCAAAFAKLKPKKKAPKAKSPKPKPRVVCRNREEYDAYLASPWWKARRKTALRAAKYKCACCGSSEKLQVHHEHYRTLGRENAKDLLVLCEECHRRAHGLFPKGMKF